MPHVVVTEDPRARVKWRDFDRRLFALLAHLSTGRRPGGAAIIQSVFDGGGDIGDPTDFIDDLLYEDRKYLHPFTPTPGSATAVRTAYVRIGTTDDQRYLP
jgi:hypothetical protein